MKHLQKTLLHVAMLATFCGSLSTFAGDQLSTLKIENEIMYFSIADAPAKSAACALSKNIGIWAVSIQTRRGKSIYHAVMSAAATEQTIEVQSAGDCLDVAGFERPLSIKIINNN